MRRRAYTWLMKFVQLLLAVCVAGSMLGCGQKGPLVMPDAQKHKRTVPSIPGAPAKPAIGGGTARPAPEGAGTATSPAPPASTPPASAPPVPSNPPPADLSNP